MKKTLPAVLAAGLLSVTMMHNTAADTPEKDNTAGKASFKARCVSCHALDPAKNSFGPSLFGVVDRKAGSLPRFAYSKAMAKADIAWTEDNLRSWMQGNDKMVPGTRMRHIAVADATERETLLAFLATLK